MTTLLLIRHGENDFLKKNKMPGRLPGIHLNARGRAQAEELAAALKDIPLAAIYASPLERALETAEPLARDKGLDIHIFPELTDTDVGAWAGRSWKVLRRTRAWKTIQERPSAFRFPGGESFPECQTRTVATLQQIAASHKPEEIVAVVFHADPIKLAVAHLLGMPLDHFQRLTVETGSITELKFGKTGARLTRLNCKPPALSGQGK
jgi:probable phosphomutase (TIGR03848 family)